MKSTTDAQSPVYRTQPDLQISENEDQLVIQNKKGHSVCELNKIAALIFYQCDGIASVDTIIEQLQSAYPQTSRDEITQTTNATLKNLEQHGVLERIDNNPNARVWIIEDKDYHAVIKNPACAQVFIFFKGAANALMMPPMQFLMHSRVDDRNIIFLQDPYRAQYQLGIRPRPGTFGDLVDLLGGIIDDMPGVNEIYTVGTSTGGYAALAAGHYLQAKAAYAFSAINTRLNANNIRTRYEKFAVMSGGGKTPAFDAEFDLQVLLANDAERTDYHLFFKEQNFIDQRAASRLAELPHVSLRPLPGMSHNVANSLADNQQLGELFHEFHTIASL